MTPQDYFNRLQTMDVQGLARTLASQFAPPTSGGFAQPSLGGFSSFLGLPNIGGGSASGGAASSGGLPGPAVPPPPAVNIPAPAQQATPGINPQNLTYKGLPLQVLQKMGLLRPGLNPMQPDPMRDLMMQLAGGGQANTQFASMLGLI